MFLVLHPRHKISYFEAAKWEPAWIKTAEELVHDEYSQWLRRHGKKGSVAAGSGSDDSDSNEDVCPKKVRDKSHCTGSMLSAPS